MTKGTPVSPERLEPNVDGPRPGTGMKNGPQRRSVPSKLRSAIDALGWPHYTVGALTRIHPTTLSHYMNRKKAISHEHLPRLCEVLDCEPEDIWEEPL